MTMRMAVWGLGPHAFKNILPALASSSSMQLAGVYSRDHAKCNEAVAQFGGRVFQSSGDMLHDESVDIVYIATPTGLHFENGMAVLYAGKHLVCEKSLTADPEQSIRLVAEARERNRLLCEAFMYQYHPRARILADIVRGSEIGLPLHAFCAFGLPPLENPGFRNDAALGGGALLDVGCYPLSLMSMLFGADADVLRAMIERPDPAAADTAGTVLLRWPERTEATLTWGYNRSYTADLIIVGDSGSLYANRLFTKDTLPDSQIIVRDRTGNPRSVTIPQASAFTEMFAAIAVAVASAAAQKQLYDRAGNQARLLSRVLKCAS